MRNIPELASCDSLPPSFFCPPLLNVILSPPPPPPPPPPPGARVRSCRRRRRRRPKSGTFPPIMANETKPNLSLDKGGERGGGRREGLSFSSFSAVLSLLQAYFGGW